MINIKDFIQGVVVLLACGCMLGISSCVNKISSEVETEKIPITFSLKVKEIAATKVNGNSFTEGDQIGLYGLLSKHEMSDERYIDNLLLICGTENNLISKDVVYYPEGDATLDFIAYYPYSSEGVPEGSSFIPVTLQADQSEPENYSASDFMTASHAEVAGSTKAVELEFEHQLTRVKITLQPGEGMTVEDMLADNPRVIATGFYSRAQFNCSTRTFENYEGVTDFVPAGEWRKEGDKLLGYEFILFPQSVNDTQSFQIEWNGRVYTCPFPSINNLDRNSQYQIDINGLDANSYILEGVVASIKEWPTEMAFSEVGADDVSEALHLSVLSFDKSNIYRIHQNGREVGEICKEYLLSDQLASTAITYYPLDENKNADLTKGTVLQLLDMEGNVNGGTLVWDEESNTFEYTKGDLPPVQTVYWDESGQMHMEKQGDAMSVNVVAFMLRDLRSDFQEYPVVKIGTQYWMRENLKTGKYRDGSDIATPEVLNGEPGCYYVKNYDIYFYNGEALEMGHEISPKGWRLPSMKDWKTLEAYVRGDVSLLKTGTWAPLDKNVTYTAPVSGEAMLNVRAWGCWGPSDKNKHININKMTGFWTWDYENNCLPEKTIFFTGESNELVVDSILSKGKDFCKGMPIRCIKE